MFLAEKITVDMETGKSPSRYKNCVKCLGKQKGKKTKEKSLALDGDVVGC